MRSGFTLFELILVVTVMAVVGVLVFPSAEAMLQPHRLTAASDIVRSQWALMRARAVDEGKSYRFEVMDGTGKFRITLDEPEEGNTDITEGQLPQDVLFSGGSGGSDWRRVAAYLPDGTGHEDCEVRFAFQGGTPVIIRMRAVTGAVVSVDPKSPEAQQEMPTPEDAQP